MMQRYTLFSTLPNNSSVFCGGAKDWFFIMDWFGEINGLGDYFAAKG